ncbi:hypothetical protein CsatA_022665 [Cannabis sativa]
MEKSKKEDSTELFQYIPKEIIPNIMTKLPHDLIMKLRNSYKEWKQFTSNATFIADSFFHTKSNSILIQIPTFKPSTPAHKRKYKSKLLELDENGLGFKIKNFGMAGMRRVSSCCNGLLLVNDMNVKTLVVMNTMTKCYATLPTCPSHCPHKSCGMALVFISSKKQYKVIHIYNHGFGFELLTLGTTQWKVIPWPSLVDLYSPYHFFWSDPLCTNDQLLLHWKLNTFKHFIVTMDTHEERLWRTMLPYEIIGENFSIFEMKGCLSLMSNVSSTEFDVWVLKDFDEKRVWCKSFSVWADSITYLSPKFLPNSSTKALPDFSKLEAVMTLRNGEVIVLKNNKSGCCYLYETRLERLKKCSDDICWGKSNLLHYKTSFIYWENYEELLTRETI